MAHRRGSIADAGDPAGTAALRRRFMRESDRRWRAACRLVTEAVGAGDILGLGQPNLNAIALRARHGGMAGTDPVTGFRHWLDNLLRDVVVGHDGAWVLLFVSSAEDLAAKRSRAIGVNVLPMPMAHTQPHRALVLSELDALATLGVQRGTRAAAAALTAHQRPQAAALRITAALREAMVRSRMMVDYTVAKAHAATLLHHFKAAGITKVGVDPSACKPKKYGLKTRGGVKLKVRDKDPPWFKPDIGKENQALLIGRLHEVLAGLDPDDEELARDLILASTGSRGISVKQAGLVSKLIERGGGEVPEEVEIPAKPIKYAEPEKIKPTPVEPPEGFEPKEVKTVAELKAELAKLIGKPEPEEPEAVPGLAALIGKAEKAKEKLEEMDVVNVLTAGDDDVCAECQDISESGPYDINEAQDLIPAHPNCRCTFVPADDARFSQTELG